MVKFENCKKYQLYIHLGQNTITNCSSITVALVHVNIFIHSIAKGIAPGRHRKTTVKLGLRKEENFHLVTITTRIPTGLDFLIFQFYKRVL